MKQIDKIKNKIFLIEDLKDQINNWKKDYNKITFTNGCFDILHKGHIELLSAAADLGDKLIVAINSDQSVQKLKGDHRPITQEDTRSIILASLSFVDAVVIFSEETPRNLINKLKPNILVKGGDYKVEEIVGHDMVKANGGKVIILPFIHGFSSSDIIEKIKTL